MMHPEDNPWRRLRSRIAYANDWITVREDEVIRPDGQPGIYGVVETRIATGVIALTPEDEIYLVGQYRYPLDCYSWEIVEGGADPGEPPLAAAQRELREEAGLIAEHWEQLGGEIHVSNCISSERGYVYLARGLREVAAAPEGTELLQVRKVPLEAAFGMLDRGEISDAVTIIALLRLFRWRAAGQRPA
jgi:8-oxo-dGTP pyrophosphatase MutT (NUDIX family)